MNEDQYQRLCCDVLKDKNLYEAYPSNAERLTHIDEFQTALTNILIKHDADYWLNACAQFKVPAGKVNSVTEALHKSFAKNFFTHTKDGTLIISNPHSSSLYPDKQLNKAPFLDEHRAAIQSLIETYAAMEHDNKSMNFQVMYDSVTKIENISDDNQVRTTYDSKL